MRTAVSCLLLSSAIVATLAACTSATVIGAKGESLSLFKPADQTLPRGGATSVRVVVRRDALPDAIALELTQLPAGVEVVGDAPQIAAGSNFGEFSLQARPDAEIVGSHPVKLTARAASGVSVSQTFLLTVTAK